MNPSVNETGLANPVNRVFDLKINATKMLKVGMVAFFAVLQLILIFTSGQVFAKTSDEVLINKALANAIYNCFYYDGTDTGRYMVNEISAAQVTSIDSLMTSKGQKDGTIKVPTNYGNSLRDGDISCKEVFTGWSGIFGGTISGLLKGNLNGEELLTTLGYEKGSDGGDGECFYLTYSYVGNANARTNKVCTSSVGNNIVNDEKNGNLRLLLNGNVIQLVDETTFRERDGVYESIWNIGSISSLGTLPRDNISNMCDRLGSVSGGAYNCDDYRVEANETSAVWRKTMASADEALKNLTDFEKYNESMFTMQDVYDLYIGYLFGGNSVYKDLYVGGENNCSNDKNEIEKSIPLSDGEGGIRWCRVLGEGLSSNKKVNVFVDGSWFYLRESVDIDGLIERLRNLDISGVDLALGDPETGGVEDTVSISSRGNSVCVSEGGAKALGWIVCPILEWMGSASQRIYDELVEPALEVDSRLFTNEGRKDIAKSGARMAWEAFRNIANICFIVFFLVIIFSQLTGVGVDNYGIKKALPKLIIAAVLINLSYLLCLIAVDLSNIFGIGLQTLFENFGKNLTVENITMGDETLATAEVTGLTGVGILTALIAGGAVIYANPAILLTLFVSALGVMISIFFLFLLLAAREAAIVVLVVVSPIVIVLYSLPNTKKIFDRWLRMFGGLLLVFPICGLLVGAGGYVSRLLMTSGMAQGGFFPAFMAMVVSIVPIFFIPTLLKNSFAALGNIGAKISGIGERVRKGTERRIRETGMYKGVQERGLERKTRIMAGVDTRGESKNLTGVGRFLRGGRRNIARSRAQYLKNQDAQTREDSLMGVGFEATSIAQEKKAGVDEIANYMMLINNRTDNGANEEALLGIFDEYAARGNKYGMVAAARIAGRRKDTAARFMANTIMSGTDSRGNAYDQGLMRDVAKEMSEGEKAGNYRAGTPVGFEYAAKVNQGAVTSTFQVWSTEKNNISDAMQHHVTNSSELVGVQNSSLRFIADKMEQGGMSEEEIARVRKLARETIQNRGTTGVWDTTKEENIYRIAYGDSNFAARIAEDRGAMNQGTTTQNVSPQGATGQSSTSQNNGAQPVVPQSVARAMNAGQTSGILTTRSGGATNNTQSPGPVRVQVRQVQPGERDQKDR